MILFTGGAVTAGPGQIVGEKKAEILRSHLDIQKGNANTKNVIKATKFYESIAEDAANISAVVDLFSTFISLQIVCSLDQVGLMEMKALAEMTGGSIVMSDSFQNAVFRKSFAKLFERDENGQLKLGTAATLTISNSKTFKVSGIIGFCTSCKAKAANVSDTVVGVGGTNVWRLGGIDKESTYAVFFEITNTVTNPGPIPIYIQFWTKYLHSTGHFRSRVTTIKRTMAAGDELRPIADSFDQEAAAALVARQAVYRTMTGEESIDVLRSLDRMLIKLVARFGDYRHNDPTTFRLPKQFQLYPQFMYHLRRSQYMQTFGESPDESCYYRDMLLKETTGNSLLMIQPALLQYTVEAPEAAAVLLEMDSMKQNVILLYDSFFHVLIWHGEMIAKWRDARYQDKPEYANVKLLLETPIEDAEQIINERYPVPKFIICDQGDETGQERIIKNRVIPSNQAITSSLGADYTNEDVTLKVFTNQLYRLAIQSNS